MNDSKNGTEIGKGGDGGKIFIVANEIKGTGKFMADGGDGSVGGKGGEVHLITNRNNFTGKVSVKGGKTFEVIKTSIWSKILIGVLIAVVAGIIIELIKKFL